MSVQDVREAMATALDGIPGLRCPSPYLTDQINPPQAQIDYEVNYDLTFGRGADEYLFTVWIFDQRTSERSAQVRMDEWRDPSHANSIKSVLEADTALDAACDYVPVRRAGTPTDLQVGTVHYLVVQFDVEVVLREA